MLSKKDKALLYWLDQNARAASKELAKNVGLTEQAIGYKIKKLEQDGFIKSWVTFLNTLSLGFNHYKVLVRLKGIDTKSEQQFISFLTAKKYMHWVASCSGSWDINFTIYAKNMREFSDHYREIEAKFGQYIAVKSITATGRVPGFTRGYLIDEPSKPLLQYDTQTKVDEIDSIDWKVLRAISLTPRKSAVDISKEINESPEVVRYHLRKLEKSIISGYSFFFDYEKMGLQRYSVYFSLHNMSQKVENAMIQFASQHNHIVFVLILIGQYDLSLELEVPDQTILHSTIKEFREHFSDHILGFEVVQVTSEHCHNYFPFEGMKGSKS